MKQITCEYNIDTACVEVRCGEKLILAIDCIAVEKQIPRNMYERSALDYLVYNASMEYVALILSGEIEDYLRKYLRLFPHEYAPPMMTVIFYFTVSHRGSISLEILSAVFISGPGRFRPAPSLTLRWTGSRPDTNRRNPCGSGQGSHGLRHPGPHR